MFGFNRRSSKEQPSESSGDEDLLAQREQEEFESSVRAARQRAASRADVAAAVAPLAPAEAEPEIEWAEQSDVYRPRRVNARSYLAAQSSGGGSSREIRPCTLIRRTAYSAVVDHLQSDTRIELGGLLAGEALYDAELDLFIVVVEVALPALNGDGTETTFAYTPAAWEAMLPGLREMHSNWTVVGSYHSHPGMGVFLSSVDLATQAEVFPHDWQIAMVVDPVSGACGLFMGASGRPCAHTFV